jgi:hypothetical protein
MRTGMEPFVALLEAVRYAFEQIRIERRAWQAYQRNQSPRPVYSEHPGQLSPKTNEVFS